jgi:PEP-CTERM motif
MDQLVISITSSAPSFDYNIDNIVLNVVPEPGTAALLGIALAVALLFRKRLDLVPGAGILRRSQRRHRGHFRCRSPLPLHDARRLWPARPRRRDPASAGRVAAAYPRAARRREACGLARRPQCTLSARRTDNRRAPRGRRPMSRALVGNAIDG